MAGVALEEAGRALLDLIYEEVKLSAEAQAMTDILQEKADTDAPFDTKVALDAVGIAVRCLDVSARLKDAKDAYVAARDAS